ncbi:endo-1,4-beta-xylanase [Sphingomonas psychrotolerans]|uniref:Beta-xylanase n=1 Tax=Sphingomonas psychrotolerans TaxID=1327635 RepID=A0ABU3N8X2_9SPHN|nr:endo-1,4-beta-xylanase [Sphingomonas psychrotolerans]MDT8759815.1 endo-1,4-beta-xylanase [Sphingomonas psychrotolerans]
MRRRAFIAGAAAACSVPLVSSAVPFVPPLPDFDGPGLNARARRSGRRYGCAIKSGQIAKDPAFTAAVLREAGTIVQEYELKRHVTQPAPGRYDFSGNDKLVDFAEQHGLAVRGHTLVWYAMNPPWLEAALPRAAPRAKEGLLTGYIETAMRRYAGRIGEWDVVNEPVEPKEGRPDGLRAKNIWEQAFGENYIDLAFHTAREADPRARLFLTDFGLEHASRRCEARRAAILRLLERALSRRVPIDALGIQGHLKPFREPFDERTFARFLDEVRGMGLGIAITEMDIADRGGPQAIEPRDAQVAAVGKAFLDVALDNPATSSVLTWGLSDRYSWLSTYPEYRWPDGKPSRGLPLDSDLRRKRLWAAMAAAFDAAPARRASNQSEGVAA